uniref:Uncharacterized protein n=1 Tax=Globodera rostochiensis TaxID=31243 RepID=A0A914I6B7_GLORO
MNRKNYDGWKSFGVHEDYKCDRRGMRQKRDFEVWDIRWQSRPRTLGQRGHCHYGGTLGQGLSAKEDIVTSFPRESPRLRARFVQKGNRQFKTETTSIKVSASSILFNLRNVRFPKGGLRPRLRLCRLS